MGKANIYLFPGRNDFLDYNSNQIHILGPAEKTIELNGWATQLKVSVIAGNHQSIMRRDLKRSLDLELVQRDRVMTVTEGNTIAEEEH